MEKREEELFRKYLDGELALEKEREVLHMVADNPEMRSILRLEHRINKLVPGFKDLKADVPIDFSENVMVEIKDKTRADVNAEPSWFSWLQEFAKAIFEPKLVQVRPVNAIATALVVILLFGAPYFLGPQSQEQIVTQTTSSDGAGIASVSDDGEQVWTRFVY
ncbi:MAG: hypothetical protein SVT56_13485, partial [Chloroflexota bacterium]|nr:hypothetical protein [Chloroflexota bacterium]